MVSSAQTYPQDDPPLPLYQADVSVAVELPAQTAVWLASKEAAFLRGKLIWSNWDVEELKARAGEIQGSRLLTIGLDGVPM